MFLGLFRRQPPKLFMIAILTGAFLIFTITIVHSSSTFAATTVVHGLNISPLREEPTIAPGTVYTGQLVLENSGATTLALDMTAESFGVTDEEYDYSFDPGSALVNWVTFDPSFMSLAPDRSQEVTYTVSVPIGAEPRGQYISLFATSDKQTDATGITSQERVATLLYITVQGKVTRFGKIVSLRNGWFITGPSYWTAEIQNSGTTHYRSVYTETTKTLFNTTIGTGGGSDLILPASIRLVQGKIALPPFSGIYKITYNIGLGDYPAHIETRYILYVRPIDAGIVGGLILIFLIVRFFPTKKRILRSN